MDDRRCVMNRCDSLFPKQYLITHGYNGNGVLLQVITINNDVQRRKDGWDVTFELPRTIMRVFESNESWIETFFDRHLVV